MKLKAVKVKPLAKDDYSEFQIIGSNFLPGNLRELTLNQPLKGDHRYVIKMKFYATFASTGTGYIFKKYEKDGITKYVQVLLLSPIEANIYSARFVIWQLTEKFQDHDVHKIERV